MPQRVGSGSFRVVEDRFGDVVCLHGAVRRRVDKFVAEGLVFCHCPAGKLRNHCLAPCSRTKGERTASHRRTRLGLSRPDTSRSRHAAGRKSPMMYYVRVDDGAAAARGTERLRESATALVAMMS